jgi:plastocyanin
MIRIVAAVAIIAVVFAACGSSGGSPASTAAPPAATAVPATNAPASTDAAPTDAAPAGGASAAVAIGDFAFGPGDLTVSAGTTVTWTNGDAAPHSVRSTNRGFDGSGTLSKGGTFSFTFPNAGTFPYICGIHSSMTGTITVTP